MHSISIANWLHVYIHDNKRKGSKGSCTCFQPEAKVFPDPIAKGSDNDTSINHHCSHLFGHLLPTQKIPHMRNFWLMVHGKNPPVEQVQHGWQSTEMDGRWRPILCVFLANSALEAEVRSCLHLLQWCLTRNLKVRTSSLTVKVWLIVYVEENRWIVIHNGHVVWAD